MLDFILHFAFPRGSAYARTDDPDREALRAGDPTGARAAALAALGSGREQDRHGVPFFADPAELRARVRELFTRREQAVLGVESAAAARARFRAALEGLLREDPREPVLVVAHGTVISLVVAGANGRLDGFAFWERFGLGDHVVLSTPDLELREVVPLQAAP